MADQTTRNVSPPKAESLGWTDTDVRAVDTARVLAADAVQKTGNGHPGTAISLAPLAYLLYQNVIVHDVADPHWLGRDRFVLSNGHSSLTQYIQLFFDGFLEKSDISSLRTWGSKTPGHPEVHHTQGIDLTTGPLGSGVATGIGMAMAQRRQRGLYDPAAAPGESVFDHHVYIVAGDGCMMEGVASEASSLAGTQQLGNVTLIFDQNQISIEDDTDISFSEDVPKRYEAYGWDVRVVEWRTNHGTTSPTYVEDVDALFAAIEEGKKVLDKPTFIMLRTVIAWPSPKAQGTGKSHGSALGDDEVKGLKRELGFDPEQTFEVDEEMLAAVRKARAERSRLHRQAWNEQFAAWQQANPEGSQLLERVQAGQLPAGLDAALPSWEADEKGIATRAASGKVLTALADVMPELWGGSADLAESNNTTMAGQPSFLPDDRQTAMWRGNPYGRTLHFGVRENAMGMILNGIALEGLTRPYGGTFLVFSDYMRPAVRLGAIQQCDAIYVWTHDSIGLGEDGPTHQPIEHLASLRAIPGLDIVRPADANETAQVWKQVLARHGRPTGMILSRQALPVLDRSTMAGADGVAKGAYVLVEGSKSTPDVILIATGSEVSIAVTAAATLETQGVAARVVSMPCVEWFAEQDAAYQEQVLPAAVRARVSVEAGSSLGWREFVGDAGKIVAIDHFGASADGKRLFQEFGFTAEAVVAAAEASLARVSDAVPGGDAPVVATATFEEGN
ncbi:transketolase [Kineosphaera limosa]|uniref:Transketolase n=1 Tax=Kineosphaera limosa NBRC 100340 TaxID=1184609 RepID=K6WQT2_9MICO|nr:transketolase [Kineosphaera limosa]NYE03135.1 transketolase [Kineosphaera limosa]GAB94472.1 transketolase [Kineosphaera limosa NBRC 100340]